MQPHSLSWYIDGADEEFVGPAKDIAALHQSHPMVTHHPCTALAPPASSCKIDADLLQAIAIQW